MTDEQPQQDEIRGDEIKRIRTALRMTQMGLATEAGVSLPTIQRAERSDPTITWKSIRAIAEGLGVLPEEIVITNRPVYRGPSSNQAPKELLEDIPQIRALLELLSEDMRVVREYVDEQTRKQATA